MKQFLLNHVPVLLSKKWPSGELQLGEGQKMRDNLLHSQQVPSLLFPAWTFYIVAVLIPIFKRLNLIAYVPNYRKMQLNLIKEKVILNIN